jgi:hypothetical protein
LGLLYGLFLVLRKCHGEILSDGRKQVLQEEILEEDFINLGFAQATPSMPLMDVI